MAIILIRTLIIFLALIVAMRLMGKRQLGELELSELVALTSPERLALLERMTKQGLAYPAINL